MLFVVVMLAAVFYVALFTAWNAFRPQMESSVQLFASWRDILFTLPDPGFLLVLRQMIILTVAYLVFDFLSSALRRYRRRGAAPKPSWKTHKLRDYSEPL